MNTVKVTLAGIDKIIPQNDLTRHILIGWKVVQGANPVVVADETKPRQATARNNKKDKV